MSKPDALVSRNLKARYLPCPYFLDAIIGYNLIFVWRSI